MAGIPDIPTTEIRKYYILYSTYIQSIIKDFDVLKFVNVKVDDLPLKETSITKDSPLYTVKI